MPRLKAALDQGKINRFQYDTYLLFEREELGRNYLKLRLESIVLEETPINSRSSQYVWQQGRISGWRELRNEILIVKEILERLENDRDKPLTTDQSSERDRTELKLNTGKYGSSGITSI